MVCAVPTTRVTAGLGEVRGHPKHCAPHTAPPTPGDPQAREKGRVGDQPPTATAAGGLGEDLTPTPILREQMGGGSNSWCRQLPAPPQRRV